MKQSNKGLMRMALILLVTGFLTTFATALLSYWQIKRFSKGGGWYSPKGGFLENIKEAGGDVLFPTQLKRYPAVNILIAGTDVKGGVGRTDSIHLMRIYNNAGYAGVISIPRDTYVHIGDGSHMDKINAAYAIGGKDSLIKTVQNFLGAPIDHYAIVNLNAFIKVVDDFGGLDITVEKRMKYRDRRGNLDIDLQPGRQHLDGYKTMGYVRFRKDRTGDFGRITRQQNFATEFVKQKVRITNISKVQETFETLSASGDIQTDLTLNDFMYLRNFFKGEDIDQRLIPVMIPGNPRMRRGASVVEPSEPEREQVERLVLKQETPVDFLVDDPVEFVNTCGWEDRGNFIKSLLRMNGIRFSKAERGSKQPFTSVLKGMASPDLKNQLERVFGGKLQVTPPAQGAAKEPARLILGLDACRKL